jgi:hypothetical protein
MKSPALGLAVGGKDDAIAQQIRGLIETVVLRPRDSGER